MPPAVYFFVSQDMEKGTADLPWVSLSAVRIMYFIICYERSALTEGGVLGLECTRLDAIKSQIKVSLNSTSDEARLPAELKHINKRRKRN